MNLSDFKMLFGEPSKEEVESYLRDNGIDPEQVAREGSVFVKNVSHRIKIENGVKDFTSKWISILERLSPMDSSTQSQLITELKSLKDGIQEQ